MSQQYEYTFLLTIMLIGDTGVGKSGVFTRLNPSLNFQWNSNTRPTIGVDPCIAYQSPYQNSYDKSLRFHTLDASGHERFRAFIAKYYSRVNGFLLTYDITKRESFLNLASWLERSKAGASPTAEYVLLRNCCDLEEERKVSYEEGREFAEKHNMMFFEVSAKSGETIKSAMKVLASKLVDLKQKEGELRRAALREEIALERKSQVQKVEIFKKILQSLSEGFLNFFL